jgi:hypothetical protein
VPSELRTTAVVVLALAGAIVGLPRTVRAQDPYQRWPYRFGVADSSLKFDIKPRGVARNATVYVDGYLAGVVDDYDGAFQRLHLPSGQHEVVVFLDGYRSIEQRLYLSPNSTRKFEGTLERLSPGEAPPAPPVPSERPERRETYRRPPSREPIPPRRGPVSPPPPPPERGRSSQSPSRFGSLAIQVQPSGADVFIDGERWQGPSSGDERLIIQVPEGPHHVEVRRDGYEDFQTDVEVRRGETAPVNVSLASKR